MTCLLGVGQFFGEPMESFEDLACKYQELYSLIDANKADAVALFNQDIFSSVNRQAPLSRFTCGFGKGH